MSKVNALSVRHRALARWHGAYGMPGELVVAAGLKP
jgi:hypothetical protein